MTIELVEQKFMSHFDKSQVFFDITSRTVRTNTTALAQLKNPGPQRRTSFSRRIAWEKDEREWRSITCSVALGSAHHLFSGSRNCLFPAFPPPPSPLHGLTKVLLWVKHLPPLLGSLTQSQKSAHPFSINHPSSWRWTREVWAASCVLCSFSPHLVFNSASYTKQEDLFFKFRNSAIIPIESHSGWKRNLPLLTTTMWHLPDYCTRSTHESQSHWHKLLEWIWVSKNSTCSQLGTWVILTCVPISATYYTAICYYMKIVKTGHSPPQLMLSCNWSSEAGGCCA